MSETKKKTFAVLTSGGDAPGMNAAVRSVVRTALHKGHSVYGIFHGYEGLMEDRMDELQERSVVYDQFLNYITDVGFCSVFTYCQCFCNLAV